MAPGRDPGSDALRLSLGLVKEIVASGPTAGRRRPAANRAPKRGVGLGLPGRRDRRTAAGSKLLNIVDECTREPLAIRVRHTFGADHVVAVIEPWCAREKRLGTCAWTTDPSSWRGRGGLVPPGRYRQLHRARRSLADALAERSTARCAMSCLNTDEFVGPSTSLHPHSGWTTQMGSPQSAPRRKPGWDHG